MYASNIVYLHSFTTLLHKDYTSVIRISCRSNITESSTYMKNGISSDYMWLHNWGGGGEGAEYRPNPLRDLLPLCSSPGHLTPRGLLAQNLHFRHDPNYLQAIKMMNSCWDRELNPRPSDLESNALFMWPHAPTIPTLTPLYLNSIRNPKSKTVLIFFFFFLLTKDNKHISKISIYFDTSRILFKSEMTMNYKYSITSKYNYCANISNFNTC